ncbi:hypothetical protein K438DRAFT_1878348 [Mycena galopus ATCC 62051]|nr:hypothetical protein K438DRAFT_1878348 [Mycena galopus ATCC 62051]
MSSTSNTFSGSITISLSLATATLPSISLSPSTSTLAPSVGFDAECFLSPRTWVFWQVSTTQRPQMVTKSYVFALFFAISCLFIGR